jgi:DNA-binding NarL/FixJ family response regulator
VFILSDNQLFREILSAALTQAIGQAHIRHAESLPDYLMHAGFTGLVLVLIDAAHPGGPAAARHLLRQRPEIPSLALCVCDHAHDAAAWTGAGIRIYAGRDLSLRDLVALMNATARRPDKAGLKPIADASPAEPPFCLTAREQEVMRLIMAGESNKDIARTLGIGLATVKSHVHNLLHKLGLERRGKLAVWHEARQSTSHERLMNGPAAFVIEYADTVSFR